LCGRNDYTFLAEGAYPYERDLKDVELHPLDTGHFALEEEGEAIANYIGQFLASRLQPVLA
jgi:pimeloyl-ACP methyl ester carboxylesterase